MNEEVKAAGGNALDLVAGNRSEVAGAVAGLLEELASRGVLVRLAMFDASARQKPSARERTAVLFDDEDPPGVIDARDDRTDPWRPSGHAG
jgi:hypothetical protein